MACNCNKTAPADTLRRQQIIEARRAAANPNRQPPEPEPEPTQ
jgi:hypothetical protein